MANKLLESVPAGSEFKLANGRALKNLYELGNALVSMDDETFFHHVNSEKNDFASWILGVFEDEGFAKELARLKSRDAIASRISKKLAGISNPQKKPAPKKKVEVKKEPEPPKEKKVEVKKEPKKVETPKEKKKKVKKAAMPKKKPPVKKELREVTEKLDKILHKEQEINRREEKIQHIEERIERELHELKLRKRSEAKFFSKEFVQGLVAGFLITLICFLLYVKFAV